MESLRSDVSSFGSFGQRGARPRVDIRFEDFEIDPQAYRLLRMGEQVRVEPKVLELIIHLIEARGRVVTKAELLQSVWDGRAVSDSALTRAIHEARRALDDCDEHRIVCTVHGRGYRFGIELQFGQRGTLSFQVPNGWRDSVHRADAQRAESEAHQAHERCKTARRTRGDAALDHIRLAREAALRSVRLDVCCAGGWSALGWIGLLWEWDWIETEARFQRALEIDPGAGHALDGLAYLRAFSGNLDRAAELVERREQTWGSDSEREDWWLRHSWLLSVTGRLDDAVALLERRIHRTPNDPLASFRLGRLYLRRSEPEAAARLWEAHPTRSHLDLLLCRCRLGLPGAIEALREIVTNDGNGKPTSAASLRQHAEILLTLDERDEALACLVHACREREWLSAAAGTEDRWQELHGLQHWNRLTELLKGLDCEAGGRDAALRIS